MTTVFCITKSAPELVRPSEPTPSGNLPLSFLDRVPGLRVLIASVFVYRHGEDAAAGAIRDALSKALVHYYPVAGRIVESPEDGELEVACTGDGAWFVENSANCSLEDVNFLQLPLVISKEELLPFPPPKVGENDLIFLMQVTKFTCGGFTVGLRSSHAMFDGVGQAQFLKAVGEIARGLDRPLVQPIWCREAIPSPPKSTFTAPSALPALPAVSYKFESSVLDVPLECINRIKNRFMEETGQRCSTFDIMAAKTWQCRARAMDLDLHEEHLHLGFAVNMRHLLVPYLAEVGGGGGYYGNCIHNMSLSAPSQRVVFAPLTEVIGLVRDAKRRAADEFVRMVEGGTPETSMVPLGRGSMCVLDWSRVGLLVITRNNTQQMGPTFPPKAISLDLKTHSSHS